MAFNPYSLPYIISALVMVALGSRTYRMRSVRGTIYLSLLSLCGAVYSLGYSLEISSQTFEWALFWLRIQYLGIPWIPSLLILFCLDYAGKEEKGFHAARAALVFIPLTVLLAQYSNSLHGLFYREIWMSEGSLFPLLHFTRGPVYWLHAAYLFISVIIANVIFTLLLGNAHKAYRPQGLVMLGASLIPWIGFILYSGGIFPSGIDPNPLFLALGASVFYYGLCRLRFFDLVPLARADLFDLMPDAALVLDGEQRLLDHNRAARQYFDKTSLVVGSNLEVVFSHWPELLQALAAGEKEIPTIIKAKTETVDWVRLQTVIYRSSAALVTGRLVILQDMSGQVRAEKKLKKQAVTDELTGIGNRRSLNEKLQREIAHSFAEETALSLLLIDVDHFKEVNDRYGHSTGDLYLKALAKLIRKRLRTGDLAARIGGEEFAVILKNAGPNDSFNLAEELRERIAVLEVESAPGPVSRTVSIGVATFHSNITSVDQFLAVADRALYRAKERGRNQTVIQ